MTDYSKKTGVQPQVREALTDISTVGDANTVTIESILATSATTATSIDATDLASALTLVNEIKAEYNQLLDDIINA